MEKSEYFFIRKAAEFIITVLIYAYRFAVSPFFGRRCRFYPSCSEYMLESVRINGIFPGIANGILRILRCNPFNDGGYDPVKKIRK